MSAPTAAITNSPTVKTPIIQSIDQSEILFEIIQAGFESVDLAGVFRDTHTLIRKVIHAEECSIFLRDRLTGQLRLEYFSSKLSSGEPRIAALDRLAERLIRDGVPVPLNRTDIDALEVDERIEGEWTSIIAVPLKTAVRTIGILVLVSTQRVLTCGPNEMDFLTRAAEQIAIAVERRRAEEALRISEGRYRMLFDHAPDGILITDGTGKLLDANADFCRSLGYSHGELLQRSADEIVASSEIPQIGIALQDIAERAEHHREWRFRRKDGSEFAADVSSKLMPDGNTLAMIRDLSERRKAELERTVLAAEVEVQRERLKNIVAHVPGIVWETVLDRETNRQVGNFVSEYLTTMLGYSVSEWLAKPDFWASIVDPGFPRRSDAVAAFSSGEGRMREIPLISKNGRIVWVEAHTTGVIDPNGKVEGTRGVMLDISERKRSENALRQSEERYRELVENALDIIYVHDLDGNYTSINQAAEKITGFSRDEILSMNMSESIAPEYLEKARKMMAAKLEGRDVTAYEIELIAKDGHRLVLEVNSRLVYDNGVPVAIQGIARDTTERHLLEEKYRQSQKLEAVGLLAGGISHDFNNLLTAITGYSEITLARMSPDDPSRHNIEEIKEIGDRASALTRQLLAFSRKQVLKPVVHNLNSVIGSMDKMLRRLFRENIEFQIELAADLGNVEADPGQLEQVIVNLAINAQDAMPYGGKLTISTENVEFTEKGESELMKLGIGRFVKMTVTDTGEGIDEAIQERIFEPFFTTKESGKGSGLGLSTVHGIIKQSGGDILVHSAKGKGTTFEIYLPSTGESQKVQTWAPRKTQNYAGNETVLLVEDDRSVRKLVREILTEKGYEVLEASSGESALAICGDRQEPIHMLLTDLVMPQMSGIELTTRVRHLHPEAKPLVMTGYASDSPIRGSMANFDATFIEKPFTPESLARKVRQVLES